MRLTINGEQVDFSLENERTLGEVAHGIQTWLAAAGFHVTGMRADARDLLLTAAAPGGIPAAAPGGISAAAPGGIPAAAPGGIPEHGWGSRAAGSVRELEVTATRTGDMRLEHWQTVHAWLGMLSDELRTPAEGHAGTLAELLANMPETIEGFKANPFMPRGSDAGERFEALFKGQGAAAEMPPGAAAVLSWPVERIHSASALVDELREGLERRIAEASRPGETLSRRAAGLRESLGRLPEVSVLLQTGRDKAAMEIVIGFTDAVQSVLDLLPFLPPDQGRGKLIAELTPFLRDLVSAFGSKDSILIGDLLEYEILPRMERLTPLLEGAQ